MYFIINARWQSLYSDLHETGKECLKEMIKRALLFGKRFYHCQISVLKGRSVRSMLREVTLRKILCDLNSHIDSL